MINLPPTVGLQGVIMDPQVAKLKFCLSVEQTLTFRSWKCIRNLLKNIH